MAIVNSLRRRAAVIIAVFTIVIVGAHSIALFNVTDEQEEEFINQSVAQELDYLMGEYARNPRLVPPHSQHLDMYIARNAAELAALPPYLQKLPIGLHEVMIDRGELHVGVSAHGEVRFYVAYDAQPHEELMNQFGWLLFFGVFTAAIAASLLGYWIAGLVVQPVTDLARRVDELGAGATPQRLAGAYVEQEVATLARAFDNYLDKVARLLERERAFTANVSHELRTPLTAIRTGCELLLQDANVDAGARRRIEAIDRAARRMTETTHALLFLARENLPQEAEEFSMHECITEALESLRPVAAQKGIALEIDVAADATARVDRQALSLVLANLLGNALANTERGFVRAIYRENALSVEDSGSGIAKSELPHIFERFYRGRGAESEGWGLGLSIVKQVCDRHRWTIELTSESGVGTRATLHLLGDATSLKPHN
jgi:signal transduction histidine kinase